MHYQKVITIKYNVNTFMNIFAARTPIFRAINGCKRVIGNEEKENW